MHKFLYLNAQHSTRNEKKTIELQSPLQRIANDILNICRNRMNGRKNRLHVLAICDRRHREENIDGHVCSVCSVWTVKFKSSTRCRAILPCFVFCVRCQIMCEPIKTNKHDKGNVQCARCVAHLPIY